MAMECRCPQALFDEIINGDEPRKAAARQAVVNWLTAQSLTIGATVIIPDPETGEEVRMLKSMGGFN